MVAKERGGSKDPPLVLHGEAEQKAQQLGSVSTFWAITSLM